MHGRRWWLVGKEGEDVSVRRGGDVRHVVRLEKSGGYVGVR